MQRNSTTLETISRFI